MKFFALYNEWYGLSRGENSSGLFKKLHGTREGEVSEMQKRVKNLFSNAVLVNFVHFK